MTTPLQTNSWFTHCPRCGAAGLKVREGKLHSCAACGLEYYRNPAVAAGAFLEDAAGRLLLIRRARDPGRGLLALPGGFIDFEETAEDALRREVKEEIGVAPGPLHYLASFPNRYVFRDVVYPVLDLFFVGTVEAAAVRCADDEVAGVSWWNPQEVQPGQLAFESIRCAFEVFRSGRKPPAG